MVKKARHINGMDAFVINVGLKYLFLRNILLIIPVSAQNVEKSSCTIKVNVSVNDAAKKHIPIIIGMGVLVHDVAV